MSALISTLLELGCCLGVLFVLVILFSTTVTAAHVIANPAPKPTSGDVGATVSPQWTTLDQAPDPAVVTDAAARNRIRATGLPWRVREVRTGIEMLLVPPGEFMMGEGPPEAGDCRHYVTMSVPFYLSRTAVTQRCWLLAMDRNPSVFKGENRPVDNVSWDVCQAFCKAIGVRLPSEAEWEYACRAGTTTCFSYGDTVTPEQVRYDPRQDKSPSGSEPSECELQATVACGTLPANPWGFFEMHGNVSEWCLDRYGPYGGNTASSTSEPQADKQHCVRGGSSIQGAYNCASAVRDHSHRGCGFGLALHGFRVAHTP